MKIPTMVCAGIVMLSGCAAPQPLPTASGKAEVTIKAPKARIQGALTNVLINAGASIQQVTEFFVVGGKRTDSVGKSLFFGSKYDSIPEDRIRFDIVEMPEGVRVVATCMIVTNPGGGFENVTTMNPGAAIYKDLQKGLDLMKTKLEAEQAAKAAQNPS